MAAHKVDMFPSINDADLDALLEARDANDTKKCHQIWTKDTA
jgi:hypothetical protein